MDLNISRMWGVHCEGNKNVEKMVRKCEDLNVHANKLLEKAHASYENKIQRHIEF
jgi:hypothetical protein